RRCQLLLRIGADDGGCRCKGENERAGDSCKRHTSENTFHGHLLAARDSTRRADDGGATNGRTSNVVRPIVDYRRPYKADASAPPTRTAFGGSRLPSVTIVQAPFDSSEAFAPGAPPAMP